MPIRTDPLTSGGKVDTRFFASEEYPEEQKSLLRYLELEGFVDKKENFVIQYRDRKWQIIFSNKLDT